MSKVIFLSYPLHGHTNPTLRLVKELIDRGEQVIYYSDETFREKIESTGAIFRQYSGAPKHKNKDGITVADGAEEFLALLCYNIAFGKIVLDKMGNEIKGEHPDYIIHDSCACWGKQIAAQLHIPAVSSITTMVWDRKLVEMDPDLYLRCTLRMSPEACYKKFRVNSVEKILANFADYLRIMFGVKDCDPIDLVVNREELNIVYTTRLIQLQAECFDDSFKFVGPSIRPPEQKVDFPFEKLTGQPLIYISLGTIFNQKMSFYNLCIEAFKNSNFQVVLAVGNETSIQNFPEIPANFIIRNYVPQLEILKRTAVFISHSGINGCSEGIDCNQVPMVLFPQGADQLIFAERLESLGAGIYVRNPDIKPDELREITEKVFSDPAYKEKCAVIAESFKEAGSYPKAADEIFAYKRSKGI